MGLSVSTSSGGFCLGCASPHNRPIHLAETVRASRAHAPGPIVLAGEAGHSLPPFPPATQGRRRASRWPRRRRRPRRLRGLQVPRRGRHPQPLLAQIQSWIGIAPALPSRRWPPPLRARRRHRTARLPREAHLPAGAPPLLLPMYGAEALLVNFIAPVVLLFGVAVRRARHRRRRNMVQHLEIDQSINCYWPTAASSDRSAWASIDGRTRATAPALCR